MSGIDANESIRVAENVVFQEIDGETVLLNLQREQYFGLDEVGTRIWGMIEEGLSFDGIVEKLAKEYEASRNQIATDLDNLLHELVVVGLIEQSKQGAETP